MSMVSTSISSESKAGLLGEYEESWSEATAEAVVDGPEKQKTKPGALKRVASCCCPHRLPTCS